MPTITTNKKAFHNYQVLEKYEAGVILTGAEVKSVKSGHINLTGGHASLRGNELWLVNCHISPYKMASNQKKHESDRDRKLLMKKKEISSMIGQLKAKGLTILPLSVYTKGGLIKVGLGLCRGKKSHDKRQSIKKRESDRRLRRVMRNKS